VTEPARHHTVASLAAHWQCSESHVYGLIARRELGHIRIGAAIRIRAEDVAAYEARRWHAPGSTAPTSDSSAAASITPLSTGGRGARDAFRRAQRMSRRPAHTGPA